MKTNAVIIFTALLLAGCATPAQRASHARLSQINVPEVDFQHASAHEVARFLCEAAQPLPDRESRPRFGVIVELLPPEERPPEKELIDPFSGTPPPKNSFFTMSARNISLLDLIHAVCHATGMEYEVDKRGLLHFKAREAQHQPAR